jgi:hypothetical protein
VTLDTVEIYRALLKGGASERRRHRSRLDGGARQEPALVRQQREIVVDAPVRQSGG